MRTRRNARNDFLQRERLAQTTRRHFLKECTLGAVAMAALGLSGCRRTGARPAAPANPMAPRPPPFAPRASRVIYLHMAGAPSQHELFDYKPELAKLDGQPCPQSFLEGKRFAFIQGVPNMLGPQFPFAQHGACGAWVSDRLPHFAAAVDEVAFIKSMHTDQFNHAPAQLLVHTGHARMGRPSMGAWVAYGLGSENQNLPGFVVLVSGGKNPDAGKTVWGSGFLPSVYQGVQCRGAGEPVLFAADPPGMSRDLRRRTIETINALNRRTFEEFGDPETLTRIQQYELAFRMQMAVPEAMDLSREPEGIRALYGAEPGKNTFANNCLLARRLAERGVRFIQLFDWGWDSHGAAESEALHQGFLGKCASVDRPMTALLQDLKQRGLLEDTLVVWGGEFGRTPMRENRGGKVMAFVGRDHNPGAFTVWLAGGGVKGGFTLGETDEMGYEAVKDRVGVHDLQATILHLLGVDHEQLTHRFQGRDFRLTDVGGTVVRSLLA
jgi:hypothetical protein